MAWIFDQHKKVFWTKGAAFILETLDEKERELILTKLDSLDKEGLKSDKIQIHKLSNTSEGSVFSLKVSIKKRLLFSYKQEDRSFFVLDIVNTDVMKIFKRGSHE